MAQKMPLRVSRISETGIRVWLVAVIRGLRGGWWEVVGGRRGAMGANRGFQASNRTNQRISEIQYPRKME